MQNNCPAVNLLFAKCKFWRQFLSCSPAPIKKHSILTTQVLWSTWDIPECDDGKTESWGHWSWVAFPEADPDLLVLPALPPSPFQLENPAHANVHIKDWQLHQVSNNKQKWKGLDIRKLPSGVTLTCNPGSSDKARLSFALRWVEKHGWFQMVVYSHRKHIHKEQWIKIKR